ncbi:hypothetical protein PRUB_a1471 [Pseudoalteromonas rubra]|uniref:Uncharacterized protein n=1 Tax=Pseudoalteromonas rubra TaxID=43658 RepID=A0A8T0C9Z0_9GAMM|nr:hypothetical protein PRUB_a1471 [Pseudoalteromonas rubra]
MLLTDLKASVSGHTEDLNWYDVRVKNKGPLIERAFYFDYLGLSDSELVNRLSQLFG